MKTKPQLNICVTYMEHDTGDVIYHTFIRASTPAALSRKIRSKQHAPWENYRIRCHKWSMRSVKGNPICWCYRK